MENRYRMKEVPERCPMCDAPVRLGTELVDGERQLVLYDMNGGKHVCNGHEEQEKHPIGQAVSGATVKENGFQLRGRRLTIMFEDGNVLTVSAAGKPLTIRLEGPAGIMQE